MSPARVRHRLLAATGALALAAAGSLVVTRDGSTAWAEPASAVDRADGAAEVVGDDAHPTRTPVSLPPTTLAPGQPAPGCTATGTSAAIDRESQRAWLCVGGLLVAEFPVTTAWSQPDPGTYRVWSRSRNAVAYEGARLSYSMEYFVVFASGEQSGARVGFHTVPRCLVSDPAIGCVKGEYAQSFVSVGDLAYRGQSHGCIRVLPDTAAVLWASLPLGARVTVLT